MRILAKKKLLSKDAPTVPEIIELLLKNRKVENTKEFLNPLNPTKIHLEQFGFKKEFEKTVKILEEIKKNNGMIVVYTDYDADGITGGAIMWETLHLLGFKVMPYVPHRKDEGYGFSKKGIDNVKKQFNPALIISVDHGITAEKKIGYAKSLGIPIIVTDHHLKPDRLPLSAAAIFHIPALSGAGVSYFLAKEFFEHFPKNSNSEKLSHNFSSDYPALAAIGAVADLVPLIGPTRSLVFHGLKEISITKRHGLKAVLVQAGIDGKPITPYEVGFMIAPRINAIGRLKHAIDALRLLCTTSSDKATELASYIGTQNKERQELVKEAVEEAKKKFEAQNLKSKIKSKIIILVSDHWHTGIIGLIASRMVEEYYRPTIILTKSDGFFKASARSIPALHMTNFLREMKDLLVDVGGHAQAAGFTIEKKSVKEFIKKAESKASKLLKKADLERTIEVDFEMPFSLATERLTRSLENLAPFGVGNLQPKFVSEVEILDAKVFGKTGTHLKIFAKDPETRSFPMELIGFGLAKELTTLINGQKRRVVYSLDIDRWGGKERLRGRIIYINQP